MAGDGNNGIGKTGMEFGYTDGILAQLEFLLQFSSHTCSTCLSTPDDFIQLSFFFPTTIFLVG